MGTAGDGAVNEGVEVDIVGLSGDVLLDPAPLVPVVAECDIPVLFGLGPTDTDAD